MYGSMKIECVLEIYCFEYDEIRQVLPRSRLFVEM